jgi:hypothetical protein
VSAAAKAEGTGYSKETGYGAYLEIVLGDDQAPLPNPDQIEPGDRFLIPIASEGVPQEVEPREERPTPKDKLMETECRGIGTCKTRIGIDIERPEGPLEKFEGPQIEFGQDYGLGGEIVLGERSTWRVPWGTFSTEAATARAVDRMELDWKDDSIIPTDIDVDVGAGATAGGIGTSFGDEDTNVSVGVSAGPSVGLRVKGHGLEGGGERYSVGGDFWILSVGFTYTDRP